MRPDPDWLGPSIKVRSGRLQKGAQTYLAKSVAYITATWLRESGDNTEELQVMAKFADNLFRITEVTNHLELTSTLHTAAGSSQESSQSQRRRQATQRKKLREAVVSFSEAGGRREEFPAAQQLDFSGFTTPSMHGRLPPRTSSTSAEISETL